MTDRAGPKAAIEFVTTSTGGTTINRRADTPEHLIHAMARAIAPTHPALVSLPDGLSCSTTAGDGAWLYSLYRRRMPIATCVLCWADHASDAAWSLATRDAPDNVVLHRPRGLPWLAAKLEISAMLAYRDPRKLVRIATAELAIAWAILDRIA